MPKTSALGFPIGVCAGVAISVALFVVWNQSCGKRISSGGYHPQKVEKSPSPEKVPLNISDVVVKEHLSRNLLFFGNSGSEAIARSRVVVVGLGGVGSHAANMLLRAGVGHLTLVDFDQVSLPVCLYNAVEANV